MLIDVDTVKNLSSRFVSNKSKLSRISSDLESVRTRVLEATKNNSEIVDPEIKRLVRELSKPENSDSHFFRSHLIQYQATKKTMVDKPNAVVSKFDSLFAHLDEVLKLGSHHSEFEKLQLEIQAAMNDFGVIEDLLFDKVDSIPRKDPYTGFYDVFHDLNDVFVSVHEVLGSSGLSEYIKPRKAVIDTFANHNKTLYHRSMFNSPGSIQLGYIASVVHQYLGVPHSSMMPNINFQYHITSGFVRSMESYQKGLFTKLKKSLLEDNFESLKEKFDFNIDENVFKQIIRKPKIFDGYVLTELGDLVNKISYAEIERSVKRVLTLDSFREMQLLVDFGLEPNFTNYTRRIYAKTNDKAEASLMDTMSEIKPLNSYRMDLDADILLYSLLEREGYSKEAKDHTVKLAAEAQRDFSGGHFISWDADKQKASSDEVLQNQFLYFKENIFDLIQERFQARNKGQTIENSLDQSFRDFSRRPFTALMNEITKEALYVGVSRLDLMQFRYIATKLFKLHREIHNQHTTYSALKRHIIKAITFI